MAPNSTTLNSPIAPPQVSCWRDIGIHGNRSCPELSHHTHCHNCPTYTHTARQLFDRPHPQSSDLSTPQSLPKHHHSSEVENSSLALFRICQQWFALPAHLFQQVLPQQTVRPIPHRSNPILKGLVNIQGELLLCVNLKNLLDIPDEASNQGIPRLIIVEWETDRWSFIVDEFQGIESIAPHQFITPPSTVLTNTQTFTHSLLPWNEGTNVNCLDEFLLFEALERTALT